MEIPPFGLYTWTLLYLLSRMPCSRDSTMAGVFVRSVVFVNCVCLEQILEPESHQTVAVWPPTSHLPNHPRRKGRYARHSWRTKDELISDVLLWTPTHGQLTKTYIHQRCVDTGWSRDDLLGAMNDREGWGEKVKGFCTFIMTWSYLPTPPLGQDMTLGQFFSGF